MINLFWFLAQIRKKVIVLVLVIATAINEILRIKIIRKTIHDHDLSLFSVLSLPRSRSLFYGALKAAFLSARSCSSDPSD